MTKTPLQLVAQNLADYLLKQEDAPMSAEAHLEQALRLLRNELGGFNFLSPEYEAKLESHIAD